MRRLQVVARILSAVLLAVLTRIVIGGLEPVSAITVVVIGGLLLATLGLRREGRRLDPDLPRPNVARQPGRDNP